MKQTFFKKTKINKVLPLIEEAFEIVDLIKIENLGKIIKIKVSTSEKESEEKIKEIFFRKGEFYNTLTEAVSEY